MFSVSNSQANYVNRYKRGNIICQLQFFFCERQNIVCKTKDIFCIQERKICFFLNMQLCQVVVMFAIKDELTS